MEPCRTDVLVSLDVENSDVVDNDGKGISLDRVNLEQGSSR